MKRKIVFRADGNSDIGLGHTIRSLALAEMLKADFSCIFATRFVTDYLRKEILATCDDLIKLEEDARHFDQFLQILQGNEIVVLDNYFYNTHYQQTIKNKGCKLVCIDDIHDKHFVADVVINHAYGAQPNMYSAEVYTRLCLGPQYALLRPIFLQAASAPKQTSNNNLLICLGGADPNNDTLKVLQELQNAHTEYHYHLVLGNAYRHKASLDTFLANTMLSVTIHQNLNANEMLALMQQCPQAVLPPSTVTLEYSCTGGQIYLKVIADNQKEIYANIINNRHALPYEALFSSSGIKQKVEPIVDGKSKERLIDVFNSIDIKYLSLKQATLSDAQLLLTWANDSTVRAQSYSTDAISYEDHIRWLTKKLSNGKSFIYIASYQEQNIGMIRFDVDSECAMLSYLIDPSFRGKGLGKQIVSQGIKQLIAQTDFKGSILAHVKQNNIASAKIFDVLHFIKQEDKEHPNSILYSKLIK